MGSQQRYTIMVEKDGHQEPATDVRWPGDFENQYVKWQAPVLTAKEAGGVQWLRADVGGRTVLVHTTTYAPGKFVVEPAINPDAPIEVVILSDQGDSVQFPVGAQFDDFRVEARYRDGYHPAGREESGPDHPRAAAQRPADGQQRPPDRRASGRRLRWPPSSRACTRRNPSA